MNPVLPRGYQFLVMLFLACCVEPYQPVIDREDVSFLVVDGFLNSTDRNARVKISRTMTIDGGVARPEQGASVLVEDEDGRSYSLLQTAPGTYALEGLTLNPAKKYRLQIRTAGREYYSDYIELEQAPPIDSISWGPSPDGITVFVNSHDPDSETRFYQWSFEETWRYRAAYASGYLFKQGQIVNRNLSESIYECYRTAPSTRILVNSTVGLSEDIVHEFPLVFIPKGDRRLRLRYSILVRQSAISKDAYEFWQQLQKTTESLGGLFDPLPSQVIGNMKSASPTEERVLGYFSGGSVTEKRIFIDLHDLPAHLLVTGFTEGCELDSLDLAMAAEVEGKMNIVSAITAGIAVVGYTASNFECTDCRLQGGTLTKPDFWEQ